MANFISGSNIITFASNNVIGTYATPVTSGGFTFSFTSQVLGTRIVLYYNSATPPTFPAECIFETGQYVPNVVNRIEFVLDVALRFT